MNKQERKARLRDAYQEIERLRYALTSLAGYTPPESPCRAMVGEVIIESQRLIPSSWVKVT